MRQLHKLLADEAAFRKTFGGKGARAVRDLALAAGQDAFKKEAERPRWERWLFWSNVAAGVVIAVIAVLQFLGVIDVMSFFPRQEIRAMGFGAPSDRFTLWARTTILRLDSYRPAVFIHENPDSRQFRAAA